MREPGNVRYNSLSYRLISVSFFFLTKIIQISQIYKTLYMLLFK